MKAEIDVAIKPFKEWDEHLRSNIIRDIESGNPTVYWDCRDDISTEMVVKALANNPANPMDYVYDQYIDTDTYDVEQDHIRSVLAQYKKEILVELGLDDLDLRELAHELRDDLLDLFSVSLDLKTLIKGTVNIRLEMLSNHDCINSHWLESSGPQYMDSYFGDCVRMLKLSPAKVKELMRSKGLSVSGSWPSKDDSKALVQYEQLWQEMENRSCGACLLVFTGTASKWDLLNLYTGKNKVIVPTGNYCGFYSSMQGGGSLIEMELARDFEIDLSKQYDRSGYLRFRLEVDDRSNPYSINEAYGVTRSFWRKPVKILPVIKKQ